ncbi:T9SS type A sorting domain-containing protein [Rufibacter roseus]|uniref:T9SS type A sorting domain-containing protein n=1 Tax=Rufibacter roseus TaxID=1567108 RepID=A0ABW2DIW5_9BACT|nr:T9SS type A sorting domain-containing protein [Rufibacter roseus]
MVKPLHKLGFLLAAGLSLVNGLDAFAQTNPAPQTLPYEQNFNSMGSAGTTLPAGVAAWVSPAKNSKEAALTTTVSADASISAVTTTQTSSSSVYNYYNNENNQLYIQLTGNSTTGASVLATAINTTNYSDVTVAYEINLIHDQPRSAGVTLQYRVGETGDWIEVADSDYSSVDRVANAKQEISVTLPDAAENQPIVQLRWVTYEVVVSGASGGRDGLGFDNIVINGSTTTGVKEFGAGNIGLYPNPTTSVAKLQLPASLAAKGNVGLTVYSLDGKVLLKAAGSEQTLNAELAQKLTAAAAGIYLVRIDGNGESFQTRIIKN